MPSNSVLRLAVAFLVTVSTLGKPVHANEHVVTVLQSAYSPELIDVEIGDTVRFVNASGSHHALSSAEGIWSIGPFENGSEVTLRIEHAVTGRFQGWADGLIEGQMNLIRAPLIR
ncbi:MAG: hypothetical protein R8G34_18420 [Paracoccaceae bacterium]|nr:hypothetical protein [Paracoccaceae bacterium]